MADPGGQTPGWLHFESMCISLFCVVPDGHGAQDFSVSGSWKKTSSTPQVAFCWHSATESSSDWYMPTGHGSQNWPRAWSTHWKPALHLVGMWHATDMWLVDSWTLPGGQIMQDRALVAESMKNVSLPHDFWGRQGLLVPSLGWYIPGSHAEHVMPLLLSPYGTSSNPLSQLVGKLHAGSR